MRGGHTLRIDGVGADGDGQATLPGGDPAFLPYTLPGETVRTEHLAKRGPAWTGTATILSPSLDRQSAPCPHFGACGGCTLQHWQHPPYLAWKADRLRTALLRAGFPDPPLRPIATTPPGARRRMDFALQRDGAAVRVGLHRHRGREVVDLQTCPVLHPRLAALLPALRTALPRITGLRRTGSAVANLLDSGIDLLLRTDGPMSATDRSHLTTLAAAAGICRVSTAIGAGLPEPAAQLGPALTRLAGVEVVPPPGAFLQASAEGEAAIVAAVLAGLPGRITARARIVELFAGCGTLSFALAPLARVVAYEGDKAAHEALRRAAAGRRVDPVLRDLARQPLTAKELAGAVAVVLDPPYAGAGPQMAALAASAVPRIIYVSCNPAALARDARPLQQAGYGVVLAQPIDQFLWSAAVEGVVVFARA